MKILFYRYGSIVEPDVVMSFQKLQIEVVEECSEIHDKTILPAKQVALVERHLSADTFMFVFSINFFPAIADICHIMQVPYVCWSVDCPVLELFSPAIRHDTNRIFLFDRAQYRRFHPYNPGCIFHLPLATNLARWDKVLAGNTPDSLAGHLPARSGISLVGSLYTEKNPMRRINPLPAFARGFIDGLKNAQMQVYGYNFLESSMEESVIQAIKTADSNFYHFENSIEDMDRFVAAHMYVGYDLAESERKQILTALSEFFDVDLYTASPADTLGKTHIHPSVSTLTQMPFIFNKSAINLNITMRPIETGLSLRLYDVLGCGGFLMTNYQEELPEYFEIGQEVEAYTGLEELADKADYYLTHEEERKRIAGRGYERIKAQHTYDHRISEMIKMLYHTL